MFANKEQNQLVASATRFWTRAVTSRAHLAFDLEEEELGEAGDAVVCVNDADGEL